MGEEKKEAPRDQQTIQQEYTQLCAQAGDKAFKIEQLKYEILQIQNRFIVLNEEMGRARAAITPAHVNGLENASGAV